MKVAYSIISYKGKHKISNRGTCVKITGETPEVRSEKGNQEKKDVIEITMERIDGHQSSVMSYIYACDIWETKIFV